MSWESRGNYRVTPPEDCCLISMLWNPGQWTGLEGWSKSHVWSWSTRFMYESIKQATDAQPKEDKVSLFTRLHGLILWKWQLSKVSLIRLIGCTIKSFGSLVTHLRAGGAREIRGFSFDNWISCFYWLKRKWPAIHMERNYNWMEKGWQKRDWSNRNLLSHRLTSRLYHVLSTSLAGLF